MQKQQIKVSLDFKEYWGGGDIKYSIKNLSTNGSYSSNCFACLNCSEVFEFCFEVESDSIIGQKTEEVNEDTNVNVDVFKVEALEEHLEELSDSKYTLDIHLETVKGEELFIESVSQDTPDDKSEISILEEEYSTSQNPTEEIEDSKVITETDKSKFEENAKMVKTKKKTPSSDSDNESKNVRNKMIKCTICGSLHRTKVRYEDHVLKKHPQEASALNVTSENLVCLTCNKKFKTNRKYAEHLAGHKNPQKLICKECGKVFNHSSNLSRHMLTVHKGIRRFICDICGISYTQSNTLKEHKMIKHQGIIPDHRQRRLDKIRLIGRRPQNKKYDPADGEMTSKCKYCTLSFRNDHSLELHMVRRHQADLPIECNMCEKRFITEIALGLHMSRKHKYTLSVTCQICEKKFASTRLSTHILEMHKREDIKPYKCQYCDKAFRQKTAKDIHESIHTGENKLECYDQTCTMRFHDHSKRYAHVKKCHPEIFELREKRKRYDGNV